LILGLLFGLFVVFYRQSRTEFLDCCGSVLFHREIRFTRCEIRVKNGDWMLGRRRWLFLVVAKRRIWEICVGMKFCAFFNRRML
jgi:hypothetical protein